MYSISIIGTFSGALSLCILLLHFRTLPFANKLLIGVIFPLTAAQFLFYLYISGHIIYIPVAYRLPSPLYLGIYPAAYLYVRTFIEDKQTLNKKEYLHFIPVVLHFLQMIPFYLMPLDEKKAIVMDILENGEKMFEFREGGLPAYLQFSILFFQGLIYCILMYKFTLSAKSTKSQALTNAGKKWLLIFTSLLLSVIISMLFPLFTPPPLGIDQVNWWVVSMMISILLIPCYFFFSPTYYMAYQGSTISGQ